MPSRRTLCSTLNIIWRSYCLNEIIKRIAFKLPTAYAIFLHRSYIKMENHVNPISPLLESYVASGLVKANVPTIQFQNSSPSIVVNPSSYRRCHHCAVDKFNMNEWKEHIKSAEHIQKVGYITGPMISSEHTFGNAEFNRRSNLTDNLLQNNSNKASFDKYCEACGLTLPTIEAWDTHTEHPTHLEKINLKNKDNTNPVPTQQYPKSCDLCDLLFDSGDAWKTHLDHPIHIENQNLANAEKTRKEQDQVFVKDERNIICCLGSRNFPENKLKQHRQLLDHIYAIWQYYIKGVKCNLIHCCFVCEEEFNQYTHWKKHVNSNEHSVATSRKNDFYMCEACGVVLLEAQHVTNHKQNETHLINILRFDELQQYYKANGYTKCRDCDEYVLVSQQNEHKNSVSHRQNAWQFSRHGQLCICKVCGYETKSYDKWIHHIYTEDHLNMAKSDALRHSHETCFACGIVVTSSEKYHFSDKNHRNTNSCFNKYNECLCGDRKNDRNSKKKLTHF